MSQKTDSALQTQNDTIQNETNTGANTAARVGQMVEDLIDSKINNDKIVDEDDMISDSATLVPTQQSVKAYVDAIGGPAWGEITGTLGNQTDLQNALGLKSPLASPTFTGVPAAPTAAVTTNTTQIATTAFVNTEIAADAPIGLPSVNATGAVISFAIPQIYGLATAITGNVTASHTGAIVGMSQILRHNDSSTPSFASEFKLMEGSRSYVINSDNYIYMIYFSSTQIQYTINQQQ